MQAFVLAILVAQAGDVTAEEYAAPTLPRVRVVLTDAYGLAHTVDAEVAATPEARTRGLMWRKSLPAGTGMFFAFPEEDVLSFWMKNTLIPLDIIFISSSFRVVDIAAWCTPKSLDARSPSSKARYVLEVPGGWTAKTGIAPGSRVQVHGLQRITIVE